MKTIAEILDAEAVLEWLRDQVRAEVPESNKRLLSEMHMNQVCLLLIEYQHASEVRELSHVEALASMVKGDADIAAAEWIKHLGSLN
jgi:hypothetical protein